MFPNFLCIGVQKSGTTWLYKNLKAHPDVWLPPVKELKYFNQKDRVPSLFALLQNQRGRKKLSRRISNALDCTKSDHPLSWYLPYFLLPRSDRWYASLFSPGENKVTGEMSPQYHILSQEKVAHIHCLMPNLKVICLLRNPIYRAWSQVSMKIFKESLFEGNNQNIHTANEATIKSLFENNKIVKISQYVDALQVWEQFYPSEQIFIAFFEQLEQSPRQLFKEICQFLGIDVFHSPNNVTVKRNIGRYSSIPEHWIQYLAQQYHESIALAHQKFNNEWTAAWLDHSEKYL